jgi:threonine/homoserine/homoserine lactone efflux protein
VIDLSTYLLFLAASGALILVPGPAQALVLAQTLGGGRRAGALAAVGLNVGTLVHAAAAALGLSAILASSAVAFGAVKLVGAAYLIWLGLRSLLAGDGVPAAPSAAAAGRTSFLQAIAAGVLNPKVAIFFLAFLPQFVDPARGSLVAQFLLLGATMALLDMLYEIALVVLVTRLRARFFGSPRFTRWQRRTSGAILVGLGARLAVAER